MFVIMKFEQNPFNREFIYLLDDRLPCISLVSAGQYERLCWTHDFIDCRPLPPIVDRPIFSNSANVDRSPIFVII
jgi:hypothetical protein